MLTVVMRLRGVKSLPEDTGSCIEYIETFFTSCNCKIVDAEDAMWDRTHLLLGLP